MQIAWDSPFSKIPEHHRIAEVNCVRGLCEKLPEGIDVVEFFGGLGLLHDVFESELRPFRHYLCELDLELVEGLRQRLPPKSTIEHGNAYVRAFPHITAGCLVSLDFNKFTVLNLLQSEEVRWTLRHIQERGASFVHLADSSPFRLHMNKGAYSKHLNTEVTDVVSYIEAIRPVYRELLGWELIHWTSHFGAAHLLFQL